MRAGDDRNVSGEALTWGVRARYWVVVLAWMGLISYLSTDAFSATNTNNYMDPVLRWLFPGITNPQLLLLHSGIRKIAHFSEFMVLGLLVFWASRAGRLPRWRARWLVTALVVSALYGIGDELHQAFTVTRTPSPIDSGIDFAGAATGQIGLYLRRRYEGWRAGRRGADG